MDRVLRRIRGAAACYEFTEAGNCRQEGYVKVLKLQYAMTSMIGSLKEQGEGVYVIASTFMSLEGLVQRLTSPEVNIPISALGVGPVTPGDIWKASKLLESKPQFATVLAFEVDVTPKATQLAEALGVKVICDYSIEFLCHQFDRHVNYLEEEEAQSKEAQSDEALSPCVLCMLPKCVFNKEDPIVVGVHVVEGLVRVGTPLCIPSRAFINLGRAAWIEKDQQPVELARQGEKVIIKIVAADPKEKQLMLGREFYVGDVLVSRISKRSIYHFIPS